MGLDMYMFLKKSEYKSTYEQEYYKGLYPEEMKQFEEEIAKRNFVSVDYEVSCQVAYWRKANAIHKWIVDNCADGRDECQEIYMPIDKLIELKDTCGDVLENHSLAKDLLPTCEGFFFGGQEYDEWYYRDVKYTYDILTKLINFLNEHSNDKKCKYWVAYEASW